MSIKYVTFISVGPTNVLLVTGSDASSKNVEIFDMASGTLRDCGRKIQPFPFDELYGASGGIVDGFPMVCGGRAKINGQWKFSTTCHSLNEHGRWIEDQTATVSPGRVFSGSVVLQNKLHMVGGSDGNSRLDSILALKPNTRTSTLSAQLPDGLYGACLIQWNETTILVTGGYSGQFETRTTFINTETDRVTPGPALQKGRTRHGCHEISIQGHPYIMVGGGYGDGYTALKSTEVLDKWNVNQGWTEGKQKSNRFFFQVNFKSYTFLFHSSG